MFGFQKCANNRINKGSNMYIYIYIFFFLNSAVPISCKVFEPTSRQISSLVSYHSLYSVCVSDGLVSASLENFRRSSTGKDENTQACPPEPLTQRVGDCFSALVTQVRSPLDMICQKVDNASKCSRCSDTVS